MRNEIEYLNINGGKGRFIINETDVFTQLGLDRL